MVKYHLALVLASLTIVGCSGFKEFKHRHAQKNRAEDAWKVAGPTGASDDYKDGWQTGYYDLSMGSDGQVPPVPPKKYWDAQYQNPVGQQCITDWYAGYQDGVIAADQVGEFEWQLVPSSGVAALPHAVITDYPTYYGGASGSGSDLPTPTPAELPATSTYRNAPQHVNDAVAATPQPPLDVRTLTGRPAEPTDASQLVHRPIPAPPAPQRVFERVPQPVRELPLAANNWEGERSVLPPMQANEPTPAERDEMYSAVQPGRIEQHSGESALASPPPHIHEKQLRSPEVVTVERAPQGSATRDRELPAQPSANSVANTAPKVILVQPFVNPSYMAELSEIRPLVTQESIADGSVGRESVSGSSPNVEIRPADSKLSREEVARQQPAAESVLTSADPTIVSDADALRNSIAASVAARRRATVADSGVEVVRAVPEPTYSSVLPFDGNQSMRRELPSKHDLASLPTAKSAEVIDIPMMRQSERSTTEFSNAEKTAATRKQEDARIAGSRAAEEMRVRDSVSNPRRSVTTTTAPTTPPRRPIVLAAQPIHIPADRDVHATPAQSNAAPQVERSGSAEEGTLSKPSLASPGSTLTETNIATASPSPHVDTTNSAAPSKTIIVAAEPIRIARGLDAYRLSPPRVRARPSAPRASSVNAVAKDVSERARSANATPAERTDDAPKPPAALQSDATEPVVKMVEPFPLNSSDTQEKPIVVGARPLRLLEASTTRR